jgi:hypothetical protein
MTYANVDGPRDLAPPTLENGTTDGRPTANDVARYTRDVNETRMSWITSEFWAMLIGIAALVVVYNLADDPSLNLWRTCLLGTLGASAYFISRGLAKSGAANERWRRDRL